MQWQLQKSKGKRARDIDSQFIISKKIRAEQARRAVPIEDTSLMIGDTPAGYLDKTLHNVECSFSIGIPHQAIQIIETIGRGSFGECHKIEIQGISFFPKGTFFVAKNILALQKSGINHLKKKLVWISCTMVLCAVLLTLAQPLG